MAWLVLGLFVEASACSGTSSKNDAGHDAPTLADGFLTSPDSPPVQDGGARDAMADSPVETAAADAAESDVPLTPDTAAPSPDAPPAKDGAQDARGISDTPGSSLDLPAQDVAESDAESRQDTDAAGLDSSPTKDTAAADAQLASDAKRDTTSIAPVSDPGIPVYTTSKAGTGACEGKTVGSLIDEIYASNTTLPGMGFYSGPIATDGSYIYAFVRSDGGFSFVFKYGSGDCPSGCIENEYWYFQTDAACVPRQVGHYRQSSLACGTPLWNIPAGAPTPTIKVCP